MSTKAKKHLQARYPEFSDLFDQVRIVPRLRRREMALPEAVVRVVTGQMLSSQAANTIYERIRAKAAAQRLHGSWLLDMHSLKECGLSASKARTISEFGAHVGPDLHALDHWYRLTPHDLLAEIKSFRGMGDWTASIIAVFYVGHEDVFPNGDGSLRKAIDLLQRRTGKKKARPLDTELASPYRAYLAMYFWRFLDSGLLDGED